MIVYRDTDLCSGHLGKRNYHWRQAMLDNIPVLLATLSLMAFSGFLTAYFSVKWDD